MKAVRLGLAGGILWGLSMFITTLVSVGSGYGAAFLNMMASIYPGFAISVPGAFLGLLYGFVDAFIFLLLLGWIYNGFCCCCSKKCKDK